MAPPTPSELPPLDQIRIAEAEAIRTLAAARQAAETVVAEAEARAVVLKREAIEAGRREGQAAYREAVSAAEAQAGVLLAESRRRAEDIRRAGADLHAVAVSMILAAVLGEDQEAARR